MEDFETEQPTFKLSPGGTLMLVNAESIVDSPTSENGLAFPKTTASLDANLVACSRRKATSSGLSLGVTCAQTSLI